MLLLAAVKAAGAQDNGIDVGSSPRASAVDYMLPGSRDLPIRCKDGDIEFFAGKTMDQVFGSAWPASPTAQATTRAEVLKPAPPTWPRGFGQAQATVVVATLVGPDGRALDAKALCATAPAIAGPAVRASLRSTYVPATFDGSAVTSVMVRVLRFHLRDVEEDGRTRRR